MVEGQLSQLPDDLADGGRAGCESFDDSGLRVYFADSRVCVDESISQAGGVRQQVSNRDLPLSRLTGPRAVCFVVALQNLRILELGNELGDRVIQSESAFFPQHHDSR